MRAGSILQPRISFAPSSPGSHASTMAMSGWIVPILLRASSPSRASAITEYPNAQRRSRQLRRNSSFGSAISMLVFCSIMFPFLSSERSRIGSVRAVYSDAARRRAANYRVRTSVITAIFYHKMEYYSMHELEKYYTMFLLNFVNYIQ